SWRKRQRLGPARVTLRDHTFEIPHDPLEASAAIPPSVAVGRVTHRLQVGGNQDLELYHWPGEYARPFDGVDRKGTRLGQKALGQISPDGRRTAEVRIGREAVEALAIEGDGAYRHLAPGRAFSLRAQSTAPHPGLSIHDGDYVVTAVVHDAEVA